MDEKLAHSMNEARFINAADNVIFPTIEKLCNDRIGRMCGSFRAGKNENLLNDVAYIVALQDLKIDLAQKQERGNRQFEKLNKELEG